MRLKLRGLISLVCVLLLMCAVFWQVWQRGGIVNTLGLPPALDSSTTARQQGLTLLGCSLPEPQKDGLGPRFTFQGADVPAFGQAAALWIAAPGTPTEVQIGHVIEPVERGAVRPEANLFSAHAYTSAGDILPLPWRMTKGRDEAGHPTGPFLIVTIPNGYSNRVHFMDINVVKGLHQLAHWRITRLPRMEHRIAPPITVRDNITINGITVSAHATRFADDHNSFLDYVLRPTLPPQSHQWDIVYTGGEYEWEPYGTKRQNEHLEHSQPILGRNGMFSDGVEKHFGGVRYGIGNAPYASASRFVRIQCELHQFETYNETATFHDIDIISDEDPEPKDYSALFFHITKPQTVTTPSGVSLSLPVQGIRTDAFGGETNMVLEAYPTQSMNMLPQSPLAKTYDKPVSVEYLFLPPFEKSSWRYETGPQHHYSLRYGMSSFTKGKYVKLPSPPAHLKQFQITVHQRVELQVIPLTFVVPVTDLSVRPAKKVSI